MVDRNCLVSPMTNPEETRRIFQDSEAESLDEGVILKGKVMLDLSSPWSLSVFDAIYNIVLLKRSSVN